MGATQSRKQADTSKFGQVYMRTDKATSQPGDTVTGMVYLNMFFAFPGNILRLRLLGKETVHLVVREERTRTAYRWNAHTKRNEPYQEVYYVDVLHSRSIYILNSIVNVHMFPTEIQPGQYCVPFSFLLPKNLPSSFYQEGHRHLGRIHYTIEAFIPSNYQSNVKMSYKQQLIIREPFVGSVDNMSGETSKQLSTCCCESGVAVLKAGFEKNAYIPGETAQITCHLDLSRSKESFKPIGISLVHHLTLQTIRERDTFTRSVRTININGVKAGATSGTSSVSLPLPSQTQPDNYRRAKSSGIQGYLLSLSNAGGVLNMTTQSQLVKSWYELKVECETEEMCSDKMAIACPVTIYSPEIQIVAIEAPADWNPTQLETANLAFAPEMTEAEIPMNTGSTETSGMAQNDVMPGGMNYQQQVPQQTQGQVQVQVQQPMGYVQPQQGGFVQQQPGFNVQVQQPGMYIQPQQGFNVQQPGFNVQVQQPGMYVQPGFNVQVQQPVGYVQVQGQQGQGQGQGGMNGYQPPPQYGNNYYMEPAKPNSVL